MYECTFELDANLTIWYWIPHAGIRGNYYYHLSIPTKQITDMCT